MTEAVSIIEWELLSHATKHCVDGGRCLRLQGKHTKLYGLDDPTANLLTAAESCIRKGYLVEVADSQWPDYAITVQGRAIANGPKPEWKPKPPRLTDQDLSLLRELTEKWQSPIDMGGRNGSHHSASLRKLCEAGLAESRNRKYPMAPSIHQRSKGSNQYRISAAGVARVKTMRKRTVAR